MMAHADAPSHPSRRRPMSEAAAPRLDLEAAAFADLTLSFDAFYRAPRDGIARLDGRRFHRCNLAGPALVTLGPGLRMTDCILSACAVTLTEGEVPAPGSILLADCALDDCVLTRWSIFVPPALAPGLLRDIPRLRVFGLPFGWG